MGIKLIIGAICSYLIIIFPTSVNAVTIINGELQAITDSEGGYASTVDLWDFTVNSSGQVTFDILSWEQGGLGPNGFTDVNGSGDHFYTYVGLNLYRKAPAGSYDYTSIGFYYGGGLGTDGSISTRDAYLNFSLVPGDYAIAVTTAYGEQNYNLLDGVQSGGILLHASPPTYGEVNSRDNPLATHADYKLTTTGDVTFANTVPIPAAIWLFGSGLIGLIGVARRKKT